MKKPVDVEKLVQPIIKVVQDKWEFIETVILAGKKCHLSLVAPYLFRPIHFEFTPGIPAENPEKMLMVTSINVARYEMLAVKGGLPLLHLVNPSVVGWDLATLHQGDTLKLIISNENESAVTVKGLRVVGPKLAGEKFRFPSIYA